MNDVVLWQQLKAGDKSALERIYRQYAADLLKYGRKFSRSEQLVEDCLQDMFVELWRNRTGLGSTDSILRYLLVSIRRKVIRESVRSRKLVSDQEPTEYQFDVVIAVDEALITAELSAERAARVKAAMESLSKRQKEVIYLKYITGLDYEDISEIMGVNYQSVRNLVSNALKKLRGDLLPYVIVAMQMGLDIVP